MGGLVCIGKVVGFVKQAFIAWAFGANASTDVFFAADGFVVSISNIISQAAAPAVLTEYVTAEEGQGRSKANKLVQDSRTFFIVLGLIFMVAIILCAKPIVGALGRAYAPEEQMQFRYFLIALSPLVLIMSIVGVCHGYLHANRRFAPTKLNSIFFSVFVISAILLFKDTLGVGALVVGILFGYLMYMIYIMMLVRKDVPLSTSNPLKNPDIRQVLKRCLPLALGTSVVDIGYIVGKMIASTLSEGSVSELSYGQVVSSDIVNAVVIRSVGAALLPALTHMVARKEDNRVISQKIREILSIMIWITMLLMILYSVEGGDLIRLFFERGGFDNRNTTDVHQIAICYSVGFVFMACRNVLTNVFYAFQNTVTPMVISCVCVAVNLLGSFLFSKLMGAAGIALGASVSIAFAAIISAILIIKHTHESLFQKDFLQALAKIAICAAVTWGAGSLSAIFFTNANFFIRMLVVGFGMVIIYVCTSLALHMPHMTALTKLLLRKIAHK